MSEELHDAAISGPVAIVQSIIVTCVMIPATSHRVERRADQDRSSE